ncbi:hypothetical protein HJFPF1_08195 [Paramyrothecium foliicola]|nr:hypothetical protein HJFPF1_08195 [Paramyrothecium foliicola]
MLLHPRDHHMSCPPAPVPSSHFAHDDDDSYAGSAAHVRSGKLSAARRVSRIITTAPSRILARFFPEPSARKSARLSARPSIRTSTISEPILINSTNIAAPDPKPRQQPRPVSMFNPKSKHFSAHEEFNKIRQRASARVSGHAGKDGASNFF